MLIGKTAEMAQVDHDWTAEVSTLAPPTLLVFADADAVGPAHITDFYALLGGGLHGPGRDGSGLRSTARPAILPSSTHYDLLSSPRPAGRGPPLPGRRGTLTDGRRMPGTGNGERTSPRFRRGHCPIWLRVPRD